MIQDEHSMADRHTQFRQSGQLPYQPRIRRNRQTGEPLPQSQQPRAADYPFNSGGDDGGNPPGMLALEDRLDKFAEGALDVFR